MLIYIGIDDTDNEHSRGTGRLARAIAASLGGAYRLDSVTRHQLWFHPSIPYTSHNSSAAIAIEAGGAPALNDLFKQVQALMLADFQPGSDPGLCVVEARHAVHLTDFGRRAQRERVNQDEAHELAQRHGARLAGLGGTQDGVIGALAAAGLAACGDDGRYLLVGRSREVSGRLPVEAVIEAGIDEVRTLDGARVEDGYVLADKLRPSRRGGQPVLFVEWAAGCWQPVKLN